MKQICEIPYDRATAAENMAIDSTLLAFGNEMDEAMWRLYGWTEPAMTFGYSQKWEWIQSMAGSFEGACVRRITGGGIVDHRHDLTYCLTLPPSHACYRSQATDLYRGLHEQIEAILLDLGFPCELAPCTDDCGNASTGKGVCFQAPEPFDVIQKPSGMKLAGAAMKRNKDGILIQGSLDLRGLQGLSQDVFKREFGSALSRWLDLEKLDFTGTLPLNTLLQERDRFSSPEWNQRR